MNVERRKTVRRFSLLCDQEMSDLGGGDVFGDLVEFIRDLLRRLPPGPYDPLPENPGELTPL